MIGAQLWGGRFADAVNVLLIMRCKALQRVCIQNWIAQHIQHVQRAALCTDQRPAFVIQNSQDEDVPEELRAQEVDGIISLSLTS